MAALRTREQDKESTVYIGGLDERVTDPIVWELMCQVGRIVNVHLPKDRITQTHQGYGFVEFQTPDEAEYAAKVMNQIRLWGKPIRVNKVCSALALLSRSVLHLYEEKHTLREPYANIHIRLPQINRKKSTSVLKSSSVTSILSSTNVHSTKPFHASALLYPLPKLRATKTVSVKDMHLFLLARLKLLMTRSRP
jgi:RNA recognition motif-containing protein